MGGCHSGSHSMIVFAVTASNELDPQKYLPEESVGVRLHFAFWYQSARGGICSLRGVLDAVQFNRFAIRYDTFPFFITSPVPEGNPFWKRAGSQSGIQQGSRFDLVSTYIYLRYLFRAPLAIKPRNSSYWHLLSSNLISCEPGCFQNDAENRFSFGNSRARTPGIP